MKIQMEPNRHRTQFPKLFQDDTARYSQLPDKSWLRSSSSESSSAAAVGEEEDDYAVLSRLGIKPQSCYYEGTHDVHARSHLHINSHKHMLCRPTPWHTHTRTRARSHTHTYTHTRAQIDYV